MKKKIVSVLIALILIAVIGGIYIMKLWTEKYSYSKEMADMDAYYQVSGEELAIILQDEMVEEKAVCRDGGYYLDLDTVHRYLSEIFYADRTEKLLLFTTPTDTVRAVFGETTYTSTKETGSIEHVIAFEEGETVYVSLEYVKLFVNFSYEVFDRHLQMYTQWGSRQEAVTNKATWVRERGGVKSPILRAVDEGETVEILEQMETWSKVKTADSIIGYIENKRLDGARVVEEIPVTEVAPADYTGTRLDTKVNLGFHAIGGPAGNDTLDSMLSESVGMNVIAPTWFSLNDNEGGFRSFGSEGYVARAHGLGLQVWGVLDDFNYRLESGTDIDVYTILSGTTARERLVKGISDTAVNLGLDGINIDFERVDASSGVHFVQFLRELSVECRNRGLVLSVDNYVPFQFNDYYRLDIQGEILDYVLIMGYDEHWHGSKEPGSVASIDYVSNGLERTCAEVPSEKVINALPFYTIVWMTEDADVTDEYLTLNREDSYMSGVDAEIQWDETTCQNYAEWTKGNVTYQVWLEDEESIAVKLNVMRAQNIGGVAAWRLGYGTEEIWQLLNAFANAE